MKIEVKEAATIAKRYTEEILGIPSEAILLEEVELSDDERYWHITLSFPRLIPPSGTVLDAFTSNVQIKYKVFKIDNESGKIVSMKIRAFAPEA